MLSNIIIIAFFVQSSLSEKQCWEPQVGDADTCVICSNNKPSESDCHALHRDVAKGGINDLSNDKEDDTCDDVITPSQTRETYKWNIYCDAVFGFSNIGKIKSNYWCGIDPFSPPDNDGNLAGQLNKWSVVYTGPEAPKSATTWMEYLTRSCSIELGPRDKPKDENTWKKYDCNKWDKRKLLQKPYTKKNDDFITKYVFHVGGGWYKTVCEHSKESATKLIEHYQKETTNYKKVGDICNKQQNSCGGNNGKTMCTCNNDGKCESTLYKDGVFCELPVNEAREESFIHPMKLQQLLDINGPSVPIYVGQPCNREYKCGPREVIMEEHGIIRDPSSTTPMAVKKGRWEKYGRNTCKCKITGMDEKTKCVSTVKKDGDHCYEVNKNKEGTFHEEGPRTIDAVSGYDNVYNGYDYNTNMNEYQYPFQYGSDYLWIQLGQVLMVVMVIVVCLCCCVLWGCIVAVGWIYSSTKLQPPSIMNENEDGALQI